MSRARTIQLGRGLGALLGLLVLLVGLPVGLAVVAGWPLPHSLPDLTSLRRALEDGWSPDGTVVVKALAIVCWFAWAELAACAVAEVLAAVQGRRRAMRVPLAGPLQPFVAHLVAAVLMALSTAGTRSVPARPSSLAAAVAAHRAIPLAVYPVGVHLVSNAADPVQSSEVGVASTVAPAPAPKQVVVRHRDDLWDLAEHHLGDPLRWREIWELNRARPQHDGRLFSDPDLIRPGWVLELPADAIDAAEALAADPARALPVGIPVLRSPDLNGSVLPLTVEETAPMTAEAESEAAMSSSPRTAPFPDVSPTHGGSLQSPPPAPVQLPSGSTVAASFAAGVAAAVATARLRRRRAWRPSAPGPAVPHPPPDVGPATQALLRAVPTPRTAEDNPSAAEAPESTVPFPFIGLHDPEPGRVAIGVRGSNPVEPVELEVTGLGGLALDGPGAPDVIRALVAGLLAKGGPYVTQLVVAEVTAGRLLPGFGAVAGVRVVADLDAVLTEAEVDLLRRTRLLGAEDLPDFATYRRLRADDLPPAVVIVTDEASDHEHGRLRAVAELGRRLGLGLVVCGPDEGCLARLHVDEQGKASHVGPEVLAALLDDARLHRLAEGEFAELVGALATAREEAPESLETAAVDHAPMVPTPSTSELEKGMGPPVAGSSVRVQLLGPYRIEVGGKEVRTGLRTSARELLAYHLLRPEGATVEAAADALWPEVDLARGPERFWTALGNLRSRVRKETGVEQPLIDKDGERYRVEAGVFGVDLWSFQAALAEARDAPDDAVEAALGRAAAAYGGELLEGSFYEWAEPIREELRRRALDALVRLAELRAGRSDTEGALQAIEQAIRVDPYAEELYRRAISLLGELDRGDVARQLFRQLGARLSDLDVDPEEETVHLLNGLSAKDATSRRAKPGLKD